jgi:amino acid transporter
MVTIMLYFFKNVYSEVVTAIPVNGGTYNVMLNTSTKKVAAFVACLSILSYVATAIVSGFESIVYLSLIWPDVGECMRALLRCSYVGPDVTISPIIQIFASRR